MSGTSIPYHLRQNKAVDRALFVGLLKKVGIYDNISSYRYIGFGGPFLEDFKIIHHELKIKDMISLENNENVIKRQKFNKPLSCITILDKAKDSTEFIQEHAFDQKTILWLDYVAFNTLPQQIQDIRASLNKMGNGDILKVTLNANSSNLGPVENKGDDLNQFRLEKFRNMVTQEFFPAGLTKDDVTNKNFPKTLLKTIKVLVNSVMQHRVKEKIHLLTSFVYEDGQKMLTITMIILDESSQEKFFSDSRIKFWQFFNEDWNIVQDISMPAISIRERLAIEALLPDADCELINQTLGFYIGADVNEARSTMDSFIRHYREFPWFGKLSL